MEKFERKHTPGPWAIKSGTITAFPAEWDAPAICKFDNGCSANWNGNASLIAAAPLLLSALIDLISVCEENPSKPGRWWSKGVPTDDQLNAAKAVIQAAVSQPENIEL